VRGVRGERVYRGERVNRDGSGKTSVWHASIPLVSACLCNLINTQFAEGASRHEPESI
jgi:hypothetical protein